MSGKCRSDHAIWGRTEAAEVRSRAGPFRNRSSPAESRLLAGNGVERVRALPRSTVLQGSGPTAAESSRGREVAVLRLFLESTRRRQPGEEEAVTIGRCGPGKSNCWSRCIPPTEDRCAENKRCRLSEELKARMTLEALRGERTLEGVASQHQAHPNQVSTWKRRGPEGAGPCSQSNRRAAAMRPFANTAPMTTA